MPAPACRSNGISARRHAARPPQAGSLLIILLGVKNSNMLVSCGKFMK